MMLGWVVYDKKQYAKNKWFADEIIRYCSSFSEIKLIIVEELNFGIGDNGIFFRYGGKAVEKPDYAVCRTIFPLLTYTMESGGIKVFNDYTVSSLCNNKCYTYALAAKCGIPVMDTVFYSRAFPGCTDISDADFPLIVKSVDGHGGSEVFWVDNASGLDPVIKGLEPKELLFQKVCNTKGKDLRVYVLGGRIIASVMRSSSGFKSNYSLGGNAAAYTLSDGEEQTVNTIINAFPALPDFVGIDFLYDDGRLIFNEIEDVVGTRMLYDILSMDAAEVFAGHIKNALKNRFK